MRNPRTPTPPILRRERHRRWCSWWPGTRIARSGPVWSRWRGSPPHSRDSNHNHSRSCHAGTVDGDCNLAPALHSVLFFLRSKTIVFRFKQQCEYRILKSILVESYVDISNWISFQDLFCDKSHITFANFTWKSLYHKTQHLLTYKINVPIHILLCLKFLFIWSGVSVSEGLLWKLSFVLVSKIINFLIYMKTVKESSDILPL